MGRCLLLLHLLLILCSQLDLLQGEALGSSGGQWGLTRIRDLGEWCFPAPGPQHTGVARRVCPVGPSQSRRCVQEQPTACAGESGFEGDLVCAPPRYEPSTQKSPAFSHVIGPGNRPLSRLGVAQRVCSLLTRGNAGPREPQDAHFLFPALQCFQCKQVNANGVCEDGKSTCQAEGNQQCFLRKVYKDNILSYGYQGCSSVCSPMTIFSTDVNLEEKCCNDSSFCNKF
ncbi:acrosomal protein SP-10-like [Canis lupus dingo]|uniref:acrosomal protein SP-10-like n=1 Tax=Canis lupus dingo TaxID=286419 RepID=UPI0020C2F7D2|nr:acrosomal protein SP-10-like [Canis lupus dingo]